MKLRLFLLLALLAVRAEAGPPPLPTIASLDLPRYMGTWYEIARLPNRFQEKCAGQSQADYRLKPEGTVQVTNRCPLADGGISEAIGEARQVGGPTSPRLEVRFAPAWLSFIPAVWGDYRVVDIDESYQWVIVGEPRREFLWILARQPELSAATLEDLLDRARKAGFETGALVTGGR